MNLLTPLELEAIGLSFRVALWSTLFSLPLALGVAYVMVRFRFVGKEVVEALLYLPLVLPPVVVGYVLMALLGRSGPLGNFLQDTFNISVIFTWKGAAIASAVMAFPLMVQAIRCAIEQVDLKLERAARTLGASPLVAFMTITLPLASPGIFLGVILGFARSLGEFGATLTFVANVPGETRTLPLAIYTLLQSPGAELPALRMVAVSFAVAFIALLIGHMFAKRLRMRMLGGMG